MLEFDIHIPTLASAAGLQLFLAPLLYTQVQKIAEKAGGTAKVGPGSTIRVKIPLKGLAGLGIKVR